MNYYKFTQVSLAKIPCSILNNITNTKIHQLKVYVIKSVFVVNSPKFASTKVSLCMVYIAILQESLCLCFKIHIILLIN